MIRAVWLAFWGDLNTPSSFPSDPAGAATNQSAHMFWGLIAAIVSCMVWHAIFGEMPFRVATWAVLTLAYAVVIEKWQQSWSGPDSIIDTGFWSLGAAIPLFSLKEVSFRPKVVLELQERDTWIVLAVVAVAMMAYILPRAVRKWNGRGSDGGAA